MYRYFHELTAMSPLQFQKQLRLHAARQKMITDEVDAASAALRLDTRVQVSSIGNTNGSSGDPDARYTSNPVELTRYFYGIYYLGLGAGGLIVKQILITGATGQVGSRTIDRLLDEQDVEIVAAVRSPQKAAVFMDRGIATVVLDLDDESTHPAAFRTFTVFSFSRVIP